MHHFEFQSYMANLSFRIIYEISGHFETITGNWKWIRLFYEKKNKCKFKALETKPKLSWTEKAITYWKQSNSQFGSRCRSTENHLFFRICSEPAINIILIIIWIIFNYELRREKTNGILRSQIDSYFLKCTLL